MKIQSTVRLSGCKVKCGSCVTDRELAYFLSARSASRESTDRFPHPQGHCPAQAMVVLLGGGPIVKTELSFRRFVMSNGTIGESQPGQQGLLAGPHLTLIDSGR
jgi:organic radical activating enzyme